MLSTSFSKFIVCCITARLAWWVQQDKELPTLVSTARAQLWGLKNALYLSRCLARKYWLRTLLLRLELETGLPFYVVIRAIRRSRAKVVPSFLSYFQTLSIGPAPGIEPATSRSAVKRSNDCANPAAHFELRKLFWFYVTSRITHHQISFLAEKELLSYTFLWKTVTFNIPTYQNKSPTQPVLFCFSWRVTF